MVTRSPRGSYDDEFGFDDGFPQIDGFPDVSSLNKIRSQHPSGPSNYINYPDMPTTTANYPLDPGKRGHRPMPPEAPSAFNALLGEGSVVGPLSPRFAAAHRDIAYKMQFMVPPSFGESRSMTPMLHPSSYRQVLSAAVSNPKYQDIPDPFLDAMMSRPTATTFGDSVIKHEYMVTRDRDFDDYDRQVPAGDATHKDVVLDYEMNVKPRIAEYHHARANDPEFVDWDDGEQAMHALSEDTRYGVMQKLQSLEGYRQHKGGQ